MSFSLPELPYAYDALEPYMSRETLEYHHEKHHLAYVNNGNNLAKGTEWENKPVEEVVNGTYGKNQGLFRFTASTIRDKPFSNESSGARRCCRFLPDWRRRWLGLKPATRHTIGAEKSPLLGTMFV
jgi:Iron/manganese superoxide dismutases, alpha-hairpin domain